MNSLPETLKLVIDLGNSRAKLAVYSGNELTELIVIENPSPEKIFAAGLEKHRITSAIISSVSDDPAPYVALFPAYQWFILDKNTPLPIRNNYLTPETLGRDRLAVVAGAHILFPGQDVLVIDAGTAVTYDIIDGNGVYEGGSISPGLSMRFKALHTFTRHLPLLKPQEIDFLTGRNTNESILSGVINGLRTEIDGIIDQYRLSRPSLCVALTGGDTIYFEKTLKNSIFANPNLVLTGLKLILDYNLEK
ncbi:MAG: type III pantothenate kinase [Lentimicrobium sp.]|nr:type III pantothenate kinase [Lentimicrobium sp.]